MRRYTIDWWVAEYIQTGLRGSNIPQITAQVNNASMGVMYNIGYEVYETGHRESVDVELDGMARKKVILDVPPTHQRMDVELRFNVGDEMVSKRNARLLPINEHDRIGDHFADSLMWSYLPKKGEQSNVALHDMAEAYGVASQCEFISESTRDRIIPISPPSDVRGYGDGNEIELAMLYADHVHRCGHDVALYLERDNAYIGTFITPGGYRENMMTARLGDEWAIFVRPSDSSNGITLEQSIHRSLDISRNINGLSIPGKNLSTSRK